MTDIEKIESSLAIQITLSELLHEVLEMKPCKHEIWEDGCCRECEPNLFTRSAFLDVWDAVKEHENRIEIWQVFENERGCVEDIVSIPYSPLTFLAWLLEKDGRLGELEEVMG